MISSTSPSPVVRYRFVGGFLVALAALLCLCSSALADTNDAAARARTPKNLMVQAYTGPFRYVAGATVTVTDPVSGQTMATAKTLRHGEVRMRVAGEPSRTAPFVVTVTGGRVVTITSGRVRGRAFAGTLTTIVSELGPLSLQRVDLSTTAAAKMPLARTGGFAKNLASVRRALGFVRADKDQTLQYYSYAVGDQKLLGAVTRAGGYDAFTSLLARTARKQGRVSGLRTRVLKLPHPEYKKRSKKKPSKPSKGATSRSAAPSTRQSSSSDMANASSAPCYAQFTPPASTSSAGTTAMTDFAIEASAGLLAIVATGDPLADSGAILDGMTGFAVDTANATSDPATSSESNPQLNQIQEQLDCISNQIAALNSSLNSVSLQITMSNAQSCKSAIQSTWATYGGLVQTAADSTAADDQLTSANPSLVALMENSSSSVVTTIPEMQATCNNIIDDSLFETYVGEYPGYSQLLASLQTGESALEPSSVQTLQLFLNQWGTLEYQQMVMVSESYNYQALYGAGSQWTNENTSMGATTGSCPATPSAGTVNASTTSFCGFLQNVANVYPGNTYSDEIGLFTTPAVSCTVSSCASPSYAVSGLAVSAVPGGFGTYSASNPLPSPVSSINQISANTLFGSSAGYTSSTWSQALAEYNSVPTGTLNSSGSTAAWNPYETWSAPQTDKTAVLSNAAGYDPSAYSSFFAGQLTATVTPATSTTNGSTTPGSTTSPTWQYVGSGTSLQYNSAACAEQSWGAFSNPDPWTFQYDAPVNGVEQPYALYIGNPSTCSSGQFFSFLQIATLLSRPWTQGDAWPAAPAITTPLTSSGVLPSTTTQLAATGCGSSGCTWGYTGALPAGWSLSSSGVLTTPSCGTAGTITVVAGNNSSYSSATWTLSPPACAAPVVTSTAVTSYYDGTNATLQASGCGSVTPCTWVTTSTTGLAFVNTNGTVVCVSNESATIVMPMIATNSLGKSPAANVTVTCVPKSTTTKY